MRNDETIHDGDILSLKRENEANEVKSGTECGISIREFSTQVSDLIGGLMLKK